MPFCKQEEVALQVKGLIFDGCKILGVSKLMETEVRCSNAAVYVVDGQAVS